MEIGERIKAARQALSMSRAELAKKAGIKYPTLAGIENGDQSKTTQLPIIAEILNVSALWLETGRGDKQPVKIIDQSIYIDSDTVADAIDVLQGIARIRGIPSKELVTFVFNADNLAVAINGVIEASKQHDKNNVIDFFGEIADKLREKDEIKKGVNRNVSETTK